MDVVSIVDYSVQLAEISARLDTLISAFAFFISLWVAYLICRICYDILYPFTRM